MGLPFSVDPPPVIVPANDQPSAGASTIPSTGRRFTHRPSDTEKIGSPWAKLVVPSSGSTYQTRSALRSLPTIVPSSATIRSDGNARARRSTIIASERLSYSVTRLMSSDLKPKAGRVPQPFHQQAARVARDLGRDGAGRLQRIASGAFRAS